MLHEPIADDSASAISPKSVTHGRTLEFIEGIRIKN